METIAIIPARSGSKGVPDKNIQNLREFPLLAYSIAAAKMVPEVKRIIVSTDSEHYAEIARRYGAETPFLRPAEISGDKSSDLEVFQHAIKWFSLNEEKIPEYILHLRPTTPLRDPKIISQALDVFLKSKEATSLRSGYLAPESPFKWFLKDENGFFKGLRDDFDSEKVNLPRQSFPEVYIPDGYIDIVKSSCILERHQLHGNKMLIFESPRCYEIDTVEDFEFLSYQLQKDGSPLIDYLNKQHLTD